MRVTKETVSDVLACACYLQIESGVQVSIFFEYSLGTKLFNLNDELKLKVASVLQNFQKNGRCNIRCIADHKLGSPTPWNASLYMKKKW